MTPKWQYMSVRVDATEWDDDNRLTECGQQGWELVSTAVVGGDLIHTFKRPLPDHASTE